MIKEKNEEALRRIKTIHPDLRRAVASSANADRIFDIGKKYNLLVDKIGELASETMYLMLGVTHPDEFVGNLAERLKVDRQTASKIADDINREIFAPVREHLRGMFGGTPQKEILEERPPKNMEHGAWSMEQQKTKEPSKTQPAITTLEDLEAELERVLAEESSSSKLSKDKIEPLSVVKKPGLQVSGSTFQDSYKGTDPYREQVGEDLPNVHPKAYNAPPAQNMEQKREEFSAKGGSAFGGQRTQPTPTPKPVEEDSPFSPLHEEKTQNIEPRGKDAKPPSIPAAKPHDIREPDGTLPKFRGINMQSLLKEQGESKAPEASAPIEPTRKPEKPASAPQQKPPPPLQPPLPPQPNGGKDPYKEPII